MGRFSIGARVRDPDGDEGVIVGKPSKGYRTVAYEGLLAGLKQDRPKKSLTPIDVAPAPAVQGQWQPKVGDRVRVVDPKCMRINTPVGAKGVVTAVSGGEYFDIDLEHPTDGTINQWVNAKNVQPITDEPATSPVAAETLWAPVVGKYGKTRDGRKVGPAKLAKWPSTTCKWSLNEIWLYADDGRCGSGNPDDDLVAEWVDDEPVVAVEAVAPEPTTPERKFKVGDRVNWTRVRGEFDGSTIEGYEGIVFDWKLRATNGKHTYAFSSELELVTTPAPATPTEAFIVARLTSTGEPRPNVRPRVHATLEAAEAEAQRLADRLGDEFAVYQRVATRTVDAGPVPGMFDLGETKKSLKDPTNLWTAFGWDSAKQGAGFWVDQASTPTHLGRAILKKWIAEAEAANDNAKAAA